MLFYHPIKSNINSEILDKFLRLSVIGDLLKVPGIGLCLKKFIEKYIDRTKK